MALTYELAVRVAQDCENTCAIVKDTLRQVERFLDHNSAMAIDWGAAELPAYLTESAEGNLQGRLYTRAAVANAIGSLEQFRKLMRNQDLTGAQGDHLGNLQQLTST